MYYILSFFLRSNLFDAVISIGVIHHMSTEKRRTKAIQELARILKPGGKIMIYVWAMEQRLRKVSLFIYYSTLSKEKSNSPLN